MTITYEGASEQARQIVHHHAVLRRGLERRVGTLCAAAENGVPIQRPLAELRGYLENQILPHAHAEERTLYPAAAMQATRLRLCRLPGCGYAGYPAAAMQARGSDLVRALIAEHRKLAYLGGQLQSGADGTEAATVSEWIATLFAGHVAKENDLLLPALTGAGVDLAALLADMHRSQASAQA